ncbi:hypothetical protein R1flu_024993 [Riccia fluitans]|uniref:Uncharacterized protein n=1 Tax=Riccia fluitans TaxID=41844 RepID=A0ABD1XZJ5_9MARC
MPSGKPIVSWFFLRRVSAVRATLNFVHFHQSRGDPRLKHEKQQLVLQGSASAEFSEVVKPRALEADIVEVALMAGLGLCCSSQGLLSHVCVATSGVAVAGKSLRLQSGSICQGKNLASPGRSLSYQLCRGIRRRKLDQFDVQGKGRRIVIRAAESGKQENVSINDDGKTARKARDRVVRKTESLRGKISDFLEQKSGYSWLIGPIVWTAILVVPAATMNLASIFQRSYLGGLAATLGQDILFVISTDLFLVLTNKLGRHNQIPGGPDPWIGPWEFTGYPEGFPKILHYVSYLSVGLAALAVVFSFFTGKFFAAVAVFAPYLALIFVQVAYERLMVGERSPACPLVPIVYTVYRFRQLSRGLLLLPALKGGALLSKFINVSSVLWALYLAMYLTQLPWLYSTWNSNSAT